MEAGIGYWHSRLTVLRLNAALIQFNPNSREETRFEKAKLEKEKERAVNNILMSWEYGKTSGYAATAQFNLPLTAIWGAIREQDTLHGCTVDTVATWILETLKQCYCGWILGSSRADLDAAADVLVGGPLEGPLVRLMHSSIPSSAEQSASPG